MTGGYHGAGLLHKVTSTQEMINSYIEIGAIPALLAATKNQLEQSEVNKLPSSFLEAILNFSETDIGRIALLDHNVEPILRTIASGNQKKADNIQSYLHIYSHRKCK